MSGPTAAPSPSPPRASNDLEAQNQYHHYRQPEKPFMPLQEARIVLTAEEFEQYHARYFPHLHNHEDEYTRSLRLVEEQRRLDEERRIGREKRAMMERNRGDTSRQDENRPASVAGMLSGWRPLSLSAKSTLHVRSISQDTHAIPLPIRSPIPIDFSAPPLPIVSDEDEGESLDPLEIMVGEEAGTPPPQSVDHSTAPSTFSWATQFSGETEELRTTSHYIRKEYEEEVMLDSPDCREQRRKRLVALAHTVRQLEGIGSREPEDPTLFGKLCDAWHSRNPDQAAPPPPTDPLNENPPPFMPDCADSSNGTARHQHYRYSSSPGDPSSHPHTQSPREPQLVTPALPNQGFPRHEADEEEYSDERSSEEGFQRSIRSSYASVLHDLAMEGGFQRGHELMQQRAWMKPRESLNYPSRLRSSQIFNASPPEGFFAPGTPRPPSIHMTAEPILSLSQDSPPRRMLRKQTGNISRPIHRPIPESPEAAPVEPRKPDTSVASIGSWWSHTPTVATERFPPTVITAETEGDDEEGVPSQVDFQEGEDGLGSASGSMESGYSSPFCEAWEAIAGTTSASEIGIALTTSTAQPPLPQPLAVAQRAIAVGISEYPSSNPYLLRKSSIPSITLSRPSTESHQVHNEEIDRLAPVPEVQEAEVAAPLADSWGTLENGSCPSLSPLDQDLPTASNSPNPQHIPLAPCNTMSSSTDHQSSPLSSTKEDKQDPSDRSPKSESAELDTAPPSPTSLATAPDPLDRQTGVLRSSLIDRHPRSDRLSSHISSTGTVSSRSETRGPANPAEQSLQTDTPKSAAAPVMGELMGYRSRTASPVLGTSTAPTSQSAAPQVMFFLGFIMPWCWLFGGWSASPKSSVPLDTEKGEAKTIKPETSSSWWSRWTDHPDPWVRRNRIAAAIIMPTMFIVAIAAIITLAILKFA